MNQRAPISSVLVKPVSADCNLACKYCFYSSKADLYPETKKHQMSDRILRELTAQYMGLTWERASFCWQGGEPTLAGLDFYRKAVKYQSLFAAPGQIVENSLQTNGLLIDEEWAKFLARHKFLVGVSLDGPKELHDHYRKDHGGSPSYERVMEGIEWLKRYNVDFNILVLLNKRNVKHPRQLYRFLVNEGFKYLQFIPCAERNPKTGGFAEYSITPEEYGRFLCEVFDEWTSGGVPQVYVRDFDELLIGYVTGETPNCTFSEDCGKYVVVEYNGDVYTCDFYVDPKWFLGNLTEQPLEEIVTSEKFHQFRKQKSKLAQRCESCPWLRICRGGCPKHWALVTSDANYFCSSYQTFLEHSHNEFLRLKRHVEERR
jgi:uncharacterized protein